MAVINKKTLYSLSVETVSGTELGRVIDVELDTETHTVSAYIVRRHMLPSQLLGRTNTLRIHPRQVRSITAEKMTVDDTAIPDVEAGLASANPSPSV